MTQTIILDVPFKEKYIASTAGAKWRKDIKRWTFDGASLPVILLPYFNIKIQNENYLALVANAVSAIPNSEQSKTLDSKHIKTKNNAGIKPAINNKTELAADKIKANKNSDDKNNNDSNNNDSNIAGSKIPVSEYLTTEKPKDDIYTATKKDIAKLALLLSSEFIGQGNLNTKQNPVSKSIATKMSASFVANDVIIKRLQGVVVSNDDIYKAITFVIEHNLNCTFNSPLSSSGNNKSNRDKITSGIWLKSKNIISTKGMLDALSLPMLTNEVQSLLFDTPISDVINELETKAIATAHEQFSFLNKITMSNVDVRKFIDNDFTVEFKGHKISLPYHRKIIDVDGQSSVRVGNNKFIKLFEIPSVALFSKQLKAHINLWHANLFGSIKEGTLKSIDLLGNLWTAKVDNGSVVNGSANHGDWLITSIDNLRIDSANNYCKKTAQIIKKHHLSS